MARINKSTLTKLEIIQVASKMFLENGYTNTGIKQISDRLGMSPGNLTFYFPSKEHLLAELVDMLCEFQWELMKEEANDGHSSIMAICLELAAMAAMCEKDEIARELYQASYTSPLCLEIIRRNDTDRAKKVFAEFRPDWTDEQFAEAELLVSGIEYATIMTAGDPISLELRIEGALDNILNIFGVPSETRKIKTKKVFAMDYHNIGSRVFDKFKNYVDETTKLAFLELFKSKQSV